jgi:hypothetical protein
MNYEPTSILEPCFKKKAQKVEPDWTKWSLSYYRLFQAVLLIPMVPRVKWA